MIEESYLIRDGDFHSKIIVQYGRCDGDSKTVESILNGGSLGDVIWVPGTRGVSFKPRDGTNPSVVKVTPPTIGFTFTCVKISGRVWPMAAEQPGGVFSGKTVLRYEVIYQQIGNID